MKKLILFGAPGAGKGTLAGLIKKFNKDIVHISTGDLFRDNIKNGTEIGKKAKKYMDDGKLVPDDVVIGMVKDRLEKDDVKKHGFMLDGFPRTLAQAKALDAVTKIDTVAVVDIEKQELKNRILGRWNCTKCGKIYNMFNDKLKPRVDGKCDDCGAALAHRDDDNEATFEKRWNTYVEQSSDVIKFYDQRPGLVKHVDSTNMLGYTTDKIKKMLDL